MTEFLIALGFTGFGFFIGLFFMVSVLRDDRKETIDCGFFAHDGQLYLVTPAEPVGEGK